MVLTVRDQVSFTLFLLINVQVILVRHVYDMSIPTHFPTQDKLVYKHYSGDDITLIVDYYQDIKDVSIIFNTLIDRIPKTLEKLSGVTEGIGMFHVLNQMASTMIKTSMLLKNSVPLLPTLQLSDQPCKYKMFIFNNHELSYILDFEKGLNETLQTIETKISTMSSFISESGYILTMQNLLQAFDSINHYCRAVEKFTKIIYDLLQRKELRISQLKNFKVLGSDSSCHELGTLGLGQVISSKCESKGNNLNCLAHLSIGKNPEFVTIYTGILFHGCAISNNFVMTNNRQIFDLSCFDEENFVECILLNPGDCTNALIRQDISKIQKYCTLTKNQLKIQRGNNIVILTDLTDHEYLQLRQWYFSLPENKTSPIMLSSSTLPLQTLNIFALHNKISEISLSLPKVTFNESLLCPDSPKIIEESNLFVQYLISLGNSLSIAIIVGVSLLINKICKSKNTERQTDIPENQQDMLNLLTIMTRPMRPGINH